MLLTEKTCAFCRKFYAINTRLANISKYCSPACSRKARRIKTRDIVLCPEDLSRLLVYDADNGILYLKERPIRKNFAAIDRCWNKRWAGKPTGNRGRHGHLYIKIYNNNYAVHRVAWAIHYGEWPRKPLDHINGTPSDNRITNLREAAQSQNMMNAKLRSDNLSGHKGVCWRSKSKRWYAHIFIHGKQKSLGSFIKFNEAVAARKMAAMKYFGEFAREG
jgi:HNH endonuclease